MRAFFRGGTLSLLEEAPSPAWLPPYHKYLNRGPNRWELPPLPPKKTRVPRVAAAARVAVAGVPGGSHQTLDLLRRRLLRGAATLSRAGLGGGGDAALMAGLVSTREKVQLGLGVPAAQPHTLGGQWLPLHGCVGTRGAHSECLGPRNTGQPGSPSCTRHPHPARGAAHVEGPPGRPRACRLSRLSPQGFWVHSTPRGFGRRWLAPPVPWSPRSPGAAMLPPGTVLCVNSEAQAASASGRGPQPAAGRRSGPGSQPARGRAPARLPADGFMGSYTIQITRAYLSVAALLVVMYNIPASPAQQLPLRWGWGLQLWGAEALGPARQWAGGEHPTPRPGVGRWPRSCHGCADTPVPDGTVLVFILTRGCGGGERQTGGLGSLPPAPSPSPQQRVQCLSMQKPGVRMCAWSQSPREAAPPGVGLGFPRKFPEMVARGRRREDGCAAQRPPNCRLGPQTSA